VVLARVATRALRDASVVPSPAALPVGELLD
jgi:hypothetical protein